MQTERALSLVNEAILSLGTPEYPAYHEPHRLLEALANELKADLCREQTAKTGSSGAAKVYIALLKAMSQDMREALKYPWIDKNGRQCVCDGYRAFRLNTPLPSMPERPESAGEPVDLDSIFPSSLDKHNVLPLPSIGDVKAFLAVKRAEHKASMACKSRNERKSFEPVWYFGDGKPAVNALYLLDALNALPNATEIYYTNPVAPLYVKDNTGDAVLLPVRTTGHHAATGSAEATARQADEQAAKASRPDADQLKREADERAAIEAAKQRDREEGRKLAARNAAGQREIVKSILDEYKQRAESDPKYSMEFEQFDQMVFFIAQAEQNEAKANAA